jgi:thioesterase domain-containing protein
MNSVAATRDCLVPLAATGGCRAMFFVHAIGGTVYFMTPVAQRMADLRDVYGLQCHALDPRNTPDATIEEMASRYRRAIRLVQPTGPYEVVGYSMGGLIAAEIARGMAAEGEVVALVAVIDTIAPSVPFPDISCADALHLISRALGISPHFQGDPVRERRDLVRDFLSHYARAGKAQKRPGLTDVEHLVDDIEHLVDLYRINGSAARRYAPAALSTPLSCLVTRGGEASRSLGRWRVLAAAGLRVECLDADHFQLMHEAHADLVAGVLRRWIGERA